METFAAPKKMVENSYFPQQRKRCLANLSDDMLDPPIIDIVHYFNQLPFCFTLQSCCGHFLYNGQKNPQNLNRLPAIKTIAGVEYRIAYIAFCIENSVSGKKLLKRLEKITLANPQNIQLCSAEWFWQKQVNSYALQVQPDRFKKKDSAYLDYQEALAIEKIRDVFFTRLEELL